MYTLSFIICLSIHVFSVCGYPPFDGDNDYDVCDEILNEEVEFDEEDWTHVRYGRFICNFKQKQITYICINLQLLVQRQKN